MDMTSTSVPARELHYDFAGALNPTVGQTAVDKWLPLIVVLAWLTLLILNMFGLTPETPAFSSGFATISGLAAGYVTHSAAKTGATRAR